MRWKCKCESINNETDITCTLCNKKKENIKDILYLHDFIDINCPKCNKKLFNSNYCDACRISLCPKCSKADDYKKGGSIGEAIIYVAALPLIIMYMLFAVELPINLRQLFSNNNYCESCNIEYAVQ